MKRIAIMGNGFIGGGLAEHYRQNNEHVDVLDRIDFSFLDADAVDAYFKSHEPYDIVFFCAYIGGTRATGYNTGTDDSVIVKNIRMFDNIGRALPAGTKYIYFGSGAQYTKERNLVRVKEEELGKVIPTNEYGYAKYLSAKIIEGNPDYYDLVLFGLYGPREDPFIRFITNSCYKAILGIPLVINQNVKFDYLLIDDLFQLCDKIVYGDKPLRHRVFNATPDESITLEEIASIILNLAQSDNPVQFLNPGMNYEYTGSNERLRENFPDIRFTSYRDGIAEVYAYCKSHIDEVDVEKIRADAALANCTTKK